MLGPPDVPAGLTRNEFGTRIMKWGTGNAAARRRMATLTREELERVGVTLAMVEEWQAFYLNELRRNPDNPSADGRADLMRRAVELLGGGQ